jgi:multimeric flavodoxin WrbA/putative sterol carrier protein
MKIFAINSSPRGSGQSKTHLMLNQLVNGMRDAGARVEVVNLREKNIKNCTGCYTCWTKTPGKCIHKDDMSLELYPQWRDSDLVVYATPLYNYAINAALKAFIERTLPSLDPFFEICDGRMLHPLRHQTPGVVVLSVSGMPDEAHFNPVSTHFNYMLASPGRNLVAEIYRPAAEMVTNPIFKDILTDVLDATQQAGRELVQTSKITPQTMARIRQPVVEPKMFADMANIFWKSCIAEAVTPKEFYRKNMVPRPDSLKEFMLLQPIGLNSEAVGERQVVLQFKFTGEVTDSCHFILDKDNIVAKTGAKENPDISVNTPFEVWVDIMTGKIEGSQAFLEQKYIVDGELELMIKLFQKENNENKSIRERSAASRTQAAA